MKNFGLAIASTLAVTIAAPRVHADPLRVVVLEFSGPEKIKDEARRIVVNVIKDRHEVVSVARFAVAARRLNVDVFSPRSIPAVARQAGIDAVIQGKISEPTGGKRTLEISVIESQNGRPTEPVIVPVVKGELKTEARAVIAEDLVDILEGVSPLATFDPVFTGDAGMIDAGPAKPVALALSTPTGETTASGASPEETPLVEAQKKAAPSLFRVSAGLGVMTTKRSLSFVADPGLTQDMQPQGIDGNPGAALALTMIGQVPSIGISGHVSYERSVGMRVGYKDASLPGTSKNLSVSQRQLAALLRYTKTIRTIGVHLGTGYREVAYVISGKPGSLTIPDCRYAFLDLGAGFRLPFNKDRFALSADAAYLYALASSGITDADMYGRAGVAGWRSDVGMEFRATENTTIRAGVNYLHVSLAFEGTGELQHLRNGPNGFDVAAASDGYLGGYVLVGFLL